jgi:hypothetical protein
MSALRILLHIDGIRLLRATGSIARSPARVVLWFLFITWLVTNTLLRGVAHYHGMFGEMHEPYATATGAGILALLALSASSGAAGRVGTFANEAEAALLVRSYLPARLVVFWLQLRAGARDLIRSLFIILVIVMNYAPSRLLGAGVGMFAFLTLTFAIKLPAFLVGRRVGGRNLQTVLLVVAGLLALGTVLAIALGASGVTFATPLGSASIALWHGEMLAVIPTIVVAAAVLFVASEFARDSYPELYEALKHSESIRARFRRGLPLRTDRTVSAPSSASTSLGGPWTILWKDLPYLRRRGARIALTAEFMLACTSGILVGLLAMRDRALAQAIVFTLGTMSVFFLSASSVRLALDIGKPVWWIGDGSTLTKLVVSTIAASATVSVLLTAATVGAAATLRSGGAFYEGLCISLALPFAMRAIGVLAFALFPSPIDQRGPASLFRVLITFAALIAPITVGVVAQLFIKHYAGAVAFSVVILAEAYGALAIAAYRVGRSPFEIAHAATG